MGGDGALLVAVWRNKGWVHVSQEMTSLYISTTVVHYVFGESLHQFGFSHHHLITASAEVGLQSHSSFGQAKPARGPASLFCARPQPPNLVG